jgi:hypothetical protein
MFRKLSNGAETGGKLQTLYRILDNLGINIDHIDQAKVNAG